MVKTPCSKAMLEMLEGKLKVYSYKFNAVGHKNSTKFPFANTLGTPSAIKTRKGHVEPLWPEYEMKSTQPRREPSKRLKSKQKEGNTANGKRVVVACIGCQAISTTASWGKHGFAANSGLHTSAVK